MKFLRRILFIILSVSALVIVVGFLLPSKVQIQRSIQVNSSVKLAFSQINILKNWKKWYPWHQPDSSLQLYFSGPESGIGASLTWKSKNENTGNGVLTIFSEIPNESVQVLMDYGLNGKSESEFLCSQIYHGTKVTWSLDSELGLNPISRWFGLFADKMIGPDMERGLSNLDQTIKNLNHVNGYEILNYDMPPLILLSVRDTTSPATISEKLATMYSRITRFMKMEHLSPTGSPLAIFHSFSDAYFDIEACVPVASVINVPDDLKCLQTSAQKTIMVKYFGSHKLITRAYEAIQTYLYESGEQVSGTSWEEYVTNPGLESDSTKLQTNIYFQVK